MDASSDDHAFGQGRCDPTGQETESTHAGEESELDLGKPESGFAFGDDDIGREGRFEAAAQGLALNQGDGAQAAVVASEIVLEQIGAGMGIGRQGVGVASFDQFDEQGQVAAEAEHVFEGGTQYQVT